MDTRVPAEGSWPPPVPPVPPGPPNDVEARLAAVERQLAALESTIQESVAQEVQGAADELRRAVSDLGRLLLRDLDRLTKVLADHRDAIVERIQATARPVTDDEAGATLSPDDEPAPLEGEDGRVRVVPRRRRRAKGRRGSPAAATRDDTQGARLEQ